MNDVDVWADTAIAAMLERIKTVCIAEYLWLIESLEIGQLPKARARSGASHRDGAPDV